ncbi:MULTISPECIES: hypothetical protein [Asticcacaulis]|uniref:hypothetical protein n=1 Tax=Asticcacaulis TaxID=76890 RepID=UPI001AE2CAB1|nr:MULTISPECIES: hypothetical protein [Asticcacaulis]MBP2158495.1 hypothetical protein [Asticcacaulis solisilvae]MDR6799541.1 hypothetical protein [Asticcacaulis sp. BE141]
MTIARSALKLSCVIATAALLSAGSLAAPQAAMAEAKSDNCKPVKVVQKAKAKAKIHKVKAKPAKARTVAVVHKAKPKAKIIKVAAAPCDCRKEVKVVKLIQPVIEREVTVYRAEPRPWHAPYVDEVATGDYASYDETSHHEETSHTETRVVQRIYIRNDHYLSADTRPGRHRHTRWPRWME